MCPFQAVRDEAEKQRLASATLEKVLPDDPMASPDVDLQLETAAMADALASATMAETEAVNEVPSCVLCLW